ncbi:MAG: pyridoxine 5'-phosphate synthase [Planctomycetota bacterium]|jgi:pyridoxine 5-phosphate synthase
MAKLGVNIDHVATVRQARMTNEPDPIWAATEAQLGGADGITFHLREDRRHINDRDARLLKETVICKLNMEMSIAKSIVDIAAKLQPDQCTLVPEKRQELTTEGGLDMIKFNRRIKTAVTRLRKKSIEVSAFIEPIADQIRASADVGCQAVELWTGQYAHAKTPKALKAALKRITDSIELGHKVGLLVHAGHGLTYNNIGPLADLEGISEFNIGHSIIARSVFVGLRQAVREMKALVT